MNSTSGSPVLLIPAPSLRLSLFVISVLCLASAMVASAQILDDTTKQIYGPKSTSYSLEGDFINSRYNRRTTDTSWSIMAATYPLDTTINNLHQQNYLYGHHYTSQNLGNFLSPTLPVFYEQPTEIGRAIGFAVFDRYAITPATVRYYDTRSPFTSAYYVQGSKGQQMLELEHSRNIRYNWNAGFTLRRMTSRKIVGAISPLTRVTGKRLEADNTGLAIYTRYYTPDERYQLLVNLTHQHVNYFNTGGINQADPDSLLYEDEIANLFLARTIDKRINYHLYHELSLDQKKTIQLFHSLDYQKRANRYNDILTDAGNPNLDYSYYDSLPFRTQSMYSGAQFNFSRWYIDDRTDYRLWQNLGGIKANLASLNVMVYVRRKQFSYKQLSYNRAQIPGAPLLSDVYPVRRAYIENFAGVVLRYQLRDSLSELTAKGEYLFDGMNGIRKSMNDYMFAFKLKTRFIEAGGSTVLRSPSLVQEQYRSNLFEWDYRDSTNGYRQVLSQELFVGSGFRTKYVSVLPRAVINRIFHFIYFDTLALPRQAPYKLDMPSVELLVKLDLYKFHAELFGKYTKEYGATVFRTPEIFNHNRIYFESFLFKSKSLVQLGVDTYWRSGYNAYNYMPVTQQFYLNTHFSIPNYLLADVFLNVQIKTVRAFLRLSHVNQAAEYKGYFTTPGYSGMPRSFEFGINWRFYD